MTHRSECPTCAAWLLDNHGWFVAACVTLAEAQHRELSIVVKEHLIRVHQRHEQAA